MATAAAGIMIGIILQTGPGDPVHELPRRLRRRQPLHRARHHDDRGGHPGHGAADDAGLHHAGRAPDPGADQARGPAARGPHVRVLLRLPLRGHPAGMPRRLRGGVDRRCSMWKAGWQACKFAAAGFIVPFFFVYYPALLFLGPWSEIALAALTGGIGVVALAAGLEGYWLRTGELARARALPRRRAPADQSRPRDRRHRPRAARRRPHDPEAPPRRSRRRRRPRHEPRQARRAHASSAPALVIGTIVYGVFRLYA